MTCQCEQWSTRSLARTQVRSAQVEEEKGERFLEVGVVWGVGGGG